MKSSIIVILLILVSGGCGKKVLYDLPAAGEEGYFETAWIDPGVILEDPWYTLLRSDRIDSFYVKLKPGENRQLAPSIEFHVSGEECLSFVNLLNGRAAVVRPLFANRLRPGYYKLTFNIGRLKKEELPPDNYFLKAEYCGFTVIKDLGRF